MAGKETISGNELCRNFYLKVDVFGIDTTANKYLLLQINFVIFFKSFIIRVKWNLPYS